MCRRQPKFRRLNREGLWSEDLALDDLVEWQHRFQSEPHCMLSVTRVEHIEQAKREGKLGVIRGFQNASMIGQDIGNLDVLHTMTGQVYSWFPSITAKM